MRMQQLHPATKATVDLRLLPPTAAFSHRRPTCPFRPPSSCRRKALSSADQPPRCSQLIRPRRSRTSSPTLVITTRSPTTSRFTPGRETHSSRLADLDAAFPSVAAPPSVIHSVPRTPLPTHFIGLYATFGGPHRRPNYTIRPPHGTAFFLPVSSQPVYQFHTHTSTLV